MGIFDVVAREREAEEREAREFLHEKYRINLLKLLRERPQKFIGDVYARDKENPGKFLANEDGSPVKPVTYGPGQEIVCCPEPIEFLQVFKDYADDQEKCREIMRELIGGTRNLRGVTFRRIRLDHEPSEGIWFNRTDHGVNLRPGLLDGETGQPYAVTMGDLAVHGVVVGRTGAGKSVFLNNLIFNLLTEYAPWELDLYLADFKKVELGRYMSRYKTPHLKTCAATSEIRYVVTMLTHIVDCMQARQDLFTRLGLQKLSEFRKKYRVVLPRVVLLVDEFQQMFQEATVRESLAINELLMSVIKLGRATGFHLLFASQEMTGALSGKALANFKIRFALPCDAVVSGEILGNRAASDLDVGYVLANTVSGAEEDNMLYKVPFIPDDEEKGEDGKIKESYFYRFLKDLVRETDSFGYKKVGTFYQEDQQKEIAELEKLLNRPVIRNFKAGQLRDGRYFDIITLGRGVVYSDKHFDLETFYIERGKNKNLFAICPDVDDLAYLQKLLALNFRYSPWQDIRHIYFDFNPLLAAKYQISGDLKVERMDDQEQLELIQRTYATRLAIQEASRQESVEKFIEGFTEKMIELMGDRDAYLNLRKILLSFFEGVCPEGLPEVCQRKLEENPQFGVYTTPLLYYYRHRIQGEPWESINQPILCWISGLEYLDAVPRWLNNVLRGGMSVNMLFLLFSTTEDMRGMDLQGRCDYLFASGNNEKIYRRLDMNYTRKDRNSVVIDFKIRSLNTERSFKKYKIQTNNYEVPAMDFDFLLRQEQLARRRAQKAGN